jgi:hypothetical protein
MPIDRLTPIFVDAPPLEGIGPPADATLWRYMDLARFLALLERRALFFSSIRHFADRFEAALTPALLARLSHEGEQRVSTVRHWNLASYVNCWNEDSSESVALWSLYTSPAGGVAIKSSVKSILASLAPRDEASPRDELYIGRVQYIDYETGDIPDDNMFRLLLHKRTPYRFEREVRLIAWPRLLVDRASEMRPDAWYEAVGSIAPPGYDVGVDPNALIEAVVVAPAAPGWLLELVQAICRRYGFDASVVQSDLDAEPV